MRIFCSESLPDYASYTFNYGIYCLKESQQEVPEILARGFLPYSGNIHLKHDIFYLARSLRINTANFKETSENRRVQRKMEHLDISMEISEKSNFVRDEQFDYFCLMYAADRMGGHMPPDRFNYVFNNSTCSHIITFRSQENIVGYVLIAKEREALQYWFSFFDLNLMQDYPIGKWMMWKVIDWATKNNHQHIYLGTCYGTKSLYKVRDFKGLEFFDGYAWNSDINLLKAKCKSDDTRQAVDDLKQAEDMNLYLKNLLHLPPTSP